jgi:hypothetical protein
MRNLLISLPEPALSAAEGVEMTAKQIGYRKKLNALACELEANNIACSSLADRE